MAEHRAAPVTIRAMASASSAISATSQALPGPFANFFAVSVFTPGGPHSRRDSLFRPPRCARAVVVGIPLGRNSARDARDAQLFLADNQRSCLLRQAARLYWLVIVSTWITGGLNETAARLPMRDRRPARGGATDAARATPLRPRTGVIAGVILATSFSFVFFSRHACADVETHHRRTRRAAAVHQKRGAPPDHGSSGYGSSWP